MFRQEEFDRIRFEITHEQAVDVLYDKLNGGHEFFRSHLYRKFPTWNPTIQTIAVVALVNPIIDLLSIQSIEDPRNSEAIRLSMELSKIVAPYELNLIRSISGDHLSL